MEYTGIHSKLQSELSEKNFQLRQMQSQSVNQPQPPTTFNHNHHDPATTTTTITTTTTTTPSPNPNHATRTPTTAASACTFPQFDSPTALLIIIRKSDERGKSVDLGGRRTL